MLADGRSKIVKLKIPIAITKFCDPLVMEGSAWFQQWSTINGKPNEIQEMFKAGITSNVQHISELFSKGFRFAVLKVRAISVKKPRETNRALQRFSARVNVFPRELTQTQITWLHRQLSFPQKEMSNVMSD